MADKQKGKKLRAITASSKAYYKLQFGRTDDNKKRRLLKHCRNNPADNQNHDILARKYPKLKVDHSDAVLMHQHRSERKERLKQALHTRCRDEIQRLRQHNENQQKVQGPLISELGFREALKTIRYRMRRAA